MQNLALSIRKIRELNDYSQEYMALSIGVSTKTYANIENGRSKIKLDYLERICQTLQISVPQLFQFSTNPFPQSDTNRTITIEDQLILMQEQLDTLRLQLRFGNTNR